MCSSIVTREELQRVHQALRVVTPFEQLSPLMLTTLTVIAHCWRKSGVPKPTQEPTLNRPFSVRRPDSAKTNTNIDLKRRAAGDLD